MGLGKTLQLLALIAHARETGEKRPFLVVAPTSVLSTWRSEAARFAPGPAGRGRRRDAREAGDDGDGCRGRRRHRRHVVHAPAPGRGGVRARRRGPASSSTRRSSSRTARPRRTGPRAICRRTSSSPSPARRSRTASPSCGRCSRSRLPGCSPRRGGSARSTSAPSRRARCPRTRRAARIAPAASRGCGAASVRWCCGARRSWSPPTCPPSRSRRCGSSWAPPIAPSTTPCCSASGRRCWACSDDLDRNRFIVFRSLTLLRMLSLAPELVDPAYAHIAPSKLGALLRAARRGPRRGASRARVQPVHVVPRSRRRPARGARHPVRVSRRVDARSRRRRRRLPRGRGAGVPHQPQGGRLRAHADRGGLRVPARPVVEPGGGGAGGRSRAPHRPDRSRSTCTGSSRTAPSRRRSWRCSSARRGCSAP